MYHYVDSFLSKYVGGYRKKFCTEYTLVSMIEKWKDKLDKGGFAGGILMDLSKAFDTINHELLIAKLEAYGFGKNSLAILQDYLSNRWQRTRVGTKYSSWVKLSIGVPQGSILGPILFNVYLNDLFYIFVNSEVCNLADDTTHFVCEMELDILLQKLEAEGYSVIEWFKNNYMQLNQGKCHFLLTGCEEG